MLSTDLSLYLCGDRLSVVLSYQLPDLFARYLAFFERRIDLILPIDVLIEQCTRADDNLLFLLHCLGIIEIPAAARRRFFHMILDLAFLSAFRLFVSQFLLDLSRVWDASHNAAIAACFG